MCSGDRVLKKEEDLNKAVCLQLYFAFLSCEDCLPVNPFCSDLCFLCFHLFSGAQVFWASSVVPPPMPLVAFFALWTRVYVCVCMYIHIHKFPEVVGLLT